MEFRETFIPKEPKEFDESSSITVEAKYFPNGGDIHTELHQLADFLKEYTKSDGYVIYVHDFTESIIYILSIDMHENTSRQHFKWHVATGKTIASYVVKHKMPLIVDAFESLSLDYPYLQDISSLFPNFIMSIPLLSTDNRVLGVFEFYRNTKLTYSSSDLQKCQFLLTHCAKALLLNENAIFFVKNNNIIRSIQNYIERCVETDDEDASFYFTYEVANMARDCTRSISAAVCFEQEGEMTDVINTEETYSFGLADSGLGPIYRTRLNKPFNILILSKCIRGEIRTFNKMGFERFKSLDKNILRPFSEMFKMWSAMEYLEGYLAKQKVFSQVLMSLIEAQYQYVDYCNMYVEELTPTDDEMLKSWLYCPDEGCDRHILVSDAIVLITDILGDLPIDNQALRAFIIFLEMCHFDEENPFQVTVLHVQSMYMLQKTCKNVVYRSDEESFSMMIATLCSSFTLRDLHTPRSVIYGRYNKYGQELTRYEVTKFMLEETKLLSKLTPEQISKCLNLIKNYMVMIQLDRFRKSTSRFSQFRRIYQIDLKKFVPKSELQMDPLFLPGLACVLGNFKSPEFIEFRSQFDLAKFLNKFNPTCDQIFAILSLV